jgi:hypothetical protein
MPVGNGSAAERAVSLLQPLCATVFLSANRDQDRLRALPAQIIEDRRQELAGPLAGLERVAEEALGSHLLVLPCDMPLLRTEVLRTLQQALLRRSCTRSGLRRGRGALALPLRGPAPAMPECHPAVTRRGEAQAFGTGWRCCDSLKSASNTRWRRACVISTVCRTGHLSRPEATERGPQRSASSMRSRISVMAPTPTIR